MKITRLLFVLFFTAMIAFAGCDAKESDVDIKTNIETKLKTQPGVSGTLVDVSNGIVTLEGQCKDEACKANCEKIAQDVTGVKTVISNLTVTGMTDPRAAVPDSIVAPVIDLPEDPFNKSVEDVVKKFPTVTAETKDSVITLTGSISKSGLSTLTKALKPLKPIKIENKLTITKTSKAKHPKPKKKSKKRH